MSSRDWTLIAFLAVLLNSSCPVAVSDEGEQLAAHDATPLVYESSVAKPVQLKFQRLSAEVPAGYDREKLIGSLPDRSALTLGFFTYGDANSRPWPSLLSANRRRGYLLIGIAIRRLLPRRK